MATILVVEDDKLSQRILGKILATGGHTSLTTDSVLDAWAVLQRPTLVDLVILDNQLAGGWGWELLKSIRADVVFQNLPVVVYTGHTERSSILKYVELGVQGMLVKPYRAEVILAEVAKATASDWLGRLIESAASVCDRLKLNPKEYYSVLSTATASSEAALAEIKEAIKARPSDPRVGPQIKRLGEASATLGMPTLKATADLLERGINSRNTPDLRLRLQQVESLLRMLRHRTHVYMGVQPVAPAPAKLQPLPTPVREFGTGPAAITPFADFCRRTAAAPLWTFAGHFAGAQRSLPAGASDLSLENRFVEEPRPPVLQALLNSFEFLRQLPQLGVDELSAAMVALPGFEAVYLNVTLRLGSLEDNATTLDIPLAIHRLGVYRSGVILACARIAAEAKLDSPLDLAPLLQHTLSVGLLAYELAHSLHLGDENLSASAGLAHDLGKWIMALGEPTHYGLALGLVLQRGGSFADAERAVFNASHEDVGAAFLKRVAGDSLLEDAATFHHRPEDVSVAHAALLSAVSLANNLTWLTAAASEEQSAPLWAGLANPAHPIWACFQRAGVELPMDPPAFVDAIRAVANASGWVSSVLVNWAAQPAPIETAHPKVSR